MEEIETARVRLRMFRLDDLDRLAQIFSDPDVVRYVENGKPVSRETTELAFKSMIRHWELNGYGRWAVEDKATGELIGFGGLRNLAGTTELVYLLAKEYWGRGLATEIAQACLAFGFIARGFERIVALVKPENAASRRVLEKIGMNYDGETVYFNYQTATYSITRAAYFKRLEESAHSHLMPAVSPPTLAYQSHSTF